MARPADTVQGKAAGKHEGGSGGAAYELDLECWTRAPSSFFPFCEQLTKEGEVCGTEIYHHNQRVTRDKKVTCIATCAST